MPRQAKPKFSPPTPGEILKSYVLAGPADRRRITQDELAKAMNMSRLTVNELINGKRAITAPTALKLGRVLGTGPDIWLNLQRGVDLFKARRELADELKDMPVLLKVTAPG